MSSTQLTNSDLSEPKEVLDIKEEKPKESNEPNDISTLNAQDQEIQSEEKQKDKVLESETIVEEREQLEEEKLLQTQQNDVDNHNQEERDEENSTVKDVNTNEIEQTSKDQSSLSEWSAVWDDNVQGYYYWNTVTNETTWENPQSNNNNLMVQPEYSQHEYYYSQYGYYPEAYYYGYDHSALVASSDTSTTAVTNPEPPTNPLESILDRIDKEVKTKLDGNSSKTKKSSSTFDSQYNDQQNQNEQQHEKDEKDEKDEQTSLISSSADLDSYYDQSQATTNDSDYQSFLAEHGGNDGGDYKLTARFNARTGKFQRDPTLNPEKFSADSKAIRQMSYFFDYDQFAESRGSAASNKRLSSDASLGDSIKSPKKLNKKDIEMFKQKKKEKKDMKKKSWLLSDD